ncbi:MAG: amidase [Mycobacteriaceae bacterium]
MRHVHAFGNDSLGDFDAVGLAERISSGDVSAAELVEAAIGRTEAVNPELNGLAYEAFDRARTQASASRSGFFDGLPTYVKDNTNVAGMPTMFGTDAWQPHPALLDGDFVRLYLATGVIPLGKTQLPEFGLSAAAEHTRLGPVRNPWDTDYTAGASSSGSAAFVAAGVVPIAHADDGGGSIRIPAACNGLVGLKPSRGRLPLDKEVRRLPVNIVTHGVLTRSVRDTAAFYREAERTWRPRALPQIGDVRGAAKQRLKIAVVTRSVEQECSPELREMTLRSAALLEELGHRVEHVDKLPVPSSFGPDLLVYGSALAMAVVRTGRRMFGPTFDRTRLDNLTLGEDRYALHHLHRLPLAIVRLRALRRHTARFYRNFDVLLTPTLAHETPPVGYFDPTAGYQQVSDRLLEWVTFTPVQNVTGEPAISLPLAESASALPVGMMLSAGVGHEARLLELAFELEEARPWPRIQSPVRE